MYKLTKKDKLNIYREWTIEHKGPTYLSKKYGIGSANIKYLVSLIHRHGMKILDKASTYSKEYKERAIKRVILGNEAIYSVALDLRLSSSGMLSNWIRSYKENDELRRQNLKLTVENSFIKKLDALAQKRKNQPKQK